MYELVNFKNSLIFEILKSGSIGRWIVEMNNKMNCKHSVELNTNL